MEREKIAHQPGAHRFVLSLPQGEARLEYSLQSQWVNITHTWVPNELRGKGVADALMQACQQWCQQQGASSQHLGDPGSWLSLGEARITTPTIGNLMFYDNFERYPSGSAGSRLGPSSAIAIRQAAIGCPAR